MIVDGANVAIAAITFAGALAAGFFKLVASLIKTNEKLAKSMDGMAASNRDVAKKMGRVADETKRGADEAKQRNGHLAEIAQQNTQIIIEAIKTPIEQKVEHQTVKKQDIIKE